MTGKRLGMAAAVSAVVLFMLVLIALDARVKRSSELIFQDDPNAMALRIKDQGVELHTSLKNDIETQLRARNSKGKKGKGKRKMQSQKKGKRVYKITYPKYSVIMPNEVTYTSGATDRKGQIVVEDWRQG